MIRGFGSVLLRQAERIGERRSDRVVQRLCDEMGAILPDIRITAERGRVRLSGRGLLRRWLGDAALRWLWRLLR